jgi:hypothetical protein
MAKQINTGIKLETPKKKRPGVHAKSKTSKIKGSKNYKKRNVGQGR